MSLRRSDKRILVPSKSTQTQRKPSGDRGKENDDRPLENNSYFNKLLRDAGLILYVCPSKHRLQCDHQEVIKKLSKVFQTDLDHPSKARSFFTGAKAYLDNDVNLVGALGPTQRSSDDEGHLDLQDSLVRILLQVDDVQADLLSWLLDKMVLVAKAESGGVQKSVCSQTSMNKSQLILSQVRWLNHCVDGEALADKMVEIVQASPDELQQDVIAALPEIVEEAHHSKLAMVLRDLMKDNGNLTNVILHAFTYLSIKIDVMEEVRQSILKTVMTLPTEDLPIVIQFVMEGIEKGEELAVIAELREQLNFSSSPLMSQLTQRNVRRARKGEVKDVDAVIMHILKVSMTSLRAVCDAWIRAIEAAKLEKEQKPLDFLVLLILHSIPNRRKAVESLVKNKVRSGLFTDGLIKSTLKSHGSALKTYFDDLSSLAETLSQSIEPALSHFSIVLYSEAFFHMDRFCKQEIIVDLVTKCGCGGVGSTRSTALKALSHLAYQSPEEMIRYAVFIESILDHTSMLSLSEFRQIMDILFFIAYSSTDDIGTLRGNLHIVITKQVSSGTLKLIRMGITGGVMAVKNMSMSGNENDVTMGSTQNATSCSTVGPTGEVLKKAKRLLEAMHAKSKVSGYVGGLFMDELSNVIGMKRVEKRLEKWIADSMTDDFTNEFVVDLDDAGNAPPGDGEEYLPMAPTFKLDDDCPIAVNLCPLVIRGFGIGTSGSKCSKAIRMIPHFRLLKICIAARNNGDLGEIDALLGCPIIMPNDLTIDKFESLSLQEKNIVCTALFYCSNWFRELINAFADQEDVELRQKVLNRLKSLLRVNKDLTSCLRYNPRFVPPSVLHLTDTSSWQPPVHIASKSSKDKKGKGKGRKRKVSESVEPSQMQTQSNITKNKTAAINDALEDAPSVDLDLYAPFFRELDMTAFSILSYDTVAIGSEPPREEETKNPKLRPMELSFLLKDLLSKLQHRLISSKSKKAFPGRINLKEVCFGNLDQVPEVKVAEFGIKLLDYLFGNLDEMAKYMKRLIDINDGVMDSIGLFNDIMPIICNCIEVIFNCVKILLSWNGFLCKENKGLLKEALVKIGSRLNPQVKVSLSIQELTSAAISYLARFESTIISISCADAHLSLLESIFAYLDSDDVKHRLSEMAENYLKRDWASTSGLKEKGSKYNARVESILKIKLDHCSDISDSINSYVSDEMPKVLRAKGKDAFSDTFPTFTKQTFGLHYRIFIEYLIVYVKSLTFTKSGNLMDLLEKWDSVVHSLMNIVEVIKIQNSRVFIAPILKYSRIFLDHFLKHCMPVVDLLFNSKRQECISLLKTVQQSTRFLQHVCLHSKTNKDVTLAKHVPLLKKSLEAFVYRVKAMLAQNDAASAFWMGTLKNRDLNGQEILSQTTDEDEEEGVAEEEEEEEAMPEEDRSDVEIEEEDEESREGSGNDNDISMAF